MKNLNELVVVNAEANVEHGFFFVEFDNGKSLQCCLKAAKQDEQDLHDNGPQYLNQIEIDNNGFDEGLSYDANEWAQDEDGEMGHVQDLLIEQARQYGIEIVA